MMLELVLDNSLKQLAEEVVEPAETTSNGKMNSILLCICTLEPVHDDEKTIWLGGDEIRRDVIELYQRLASECGICMQVVMDSGSEMVSEKELGYERTENI